MWSVETCAVNDAIDSVKQISQMIAIANVRDPGCFIVDGVNVDFDDWHFNVRSSNTEPLLRLCLESLVSPADMAVRRDEVLGMIRAPAA